MAGLLPLGYQFVDFANIWALADSVNVDYTVVKTIIILDCSSILAELRSANRLPPAREGVPLEARPEAPKIRIFTSFPITIGAQSVLAGSGWGHLHKKKQEHVNENTWSMWR